MSEFDSDKNQTVEDDDVTGYKKPPKSKRFKKGVSGNPRGRPRGSKTLATRAAEVLQEKVVVLENGQRKSITKFDAIMKQVVNKAAAGEAWAIKLFFYLAQMIESEKKNLPLDYKIVVEFVDPIDGRLRTHEEYIEHKRQQKLIESPK